MPPGWAAYPYCAGTEPAATCGSDRGRFAVDAPHRSTVVTLLTQRIERLLELGFLARHHASGPAGLAALLSCYAKTIGDPMNPAGIRLPLRMGRTRRVLAMRACDIYTLAEVFHERQYELARPLGPAPVIIDAGANVGVASAWFLLSHPDARLLAIEPVSQNVHWLRKNLATDDRATIIQAALGETEGEVLMALSAHSAEHAVGDRPGVGGSETVSCRRLDRLLDEQGITTIDLLKLDVEGSEMDALAGLGTRLRDVRAIVAEVHERQIDVGAFYALLARHDFTVVRRRYYREGEESGVHTVEAWREPVAGAGAVA